MPTTSGSAPNCSALDVPVVVEDEAEHPELGERRLCFAGETDEEVDDQREDQPRQRRQAVLQRSVG